MELGDTFIVTLLCDSGQFNSCSVCNVDSFDLRHVLLLCARQLKRGYICKAFIDLQAQSNCLHELKFPVWTFENMRIYSGYYDAQMHVRHDLVSSCCSPILTGTLSYETISSNCLYEINVPVWILENAYLRIYVCICSDYYDI